MELFSTEFLSALAAIIVIDLVLAGDNAIVIALAARGLPPHLRKPAIIWGTVGAIVVRTAMTLVVVWLLKIPGLLAAGGALLIWIAWKLVIDNDSSGEGHTQSASTGFWGAMRTIVIADALMGLDNVLAVAGAAQGSFLLVVLGLLVSIPIVIWGSQLILKFVERYPIIVYFGAGVLAWTSVKMVVSEPLFQDFLVRHPALPLLGYALAIGGVVIGGFLVNHAEVRRRIQKHLVDLATEPAEIEIRAGVNQGEQAMSKILLPVDGSPNSLRAVRHVVNQFMSNHTLEVHLLNVRTPLSQHIARFVSAGTRKQFHRDEAEKVLAPARELLKRFGVPFVEHVEIGDRAETITEAAKRLGAAQIVMGTARKNSLTRLIEDSVTNRVLELTEVPVEIVAGEAVSKVERYGVPAGIAAAIALFFIAVE